MQKQKDMVAPVNKFKQFFATSYNILRIKCFIKCSIQPKIHELFLYLPTSLRWAYELYFPPQGPNGCGCGQGQEK